LNKTKNCFTMWPRISRFDSENRNLCYTYTELINGKI